MKYFIYIFVAGALWGFVGICFSYLEKYGFNVSEIVALRFIFSALIMAPTLLVNLKSYKNKNVNIVLLSGVSALVTAVCYLNAIKYTGPATACVLLYCTPIFVQIISSVSYKRKMTVVGALSIIVCVLSCAFASGVFNATINAKGVVFGIFSAFFNAMVTILNGRAVKCGYSGSQVSAGAFWTSAIFCPLLLNGRSFSKLTGVSFFWVIAIALICTVLPFTLYSKGLMGCPEEKACILSSSEPCVALIAESCLLKAFPPFYKIIGLIGVLIAVAVTASEFKKENKGVLRREFR